MKINGNADGFVKICAAFVKARLEIGGTVGKDAKGNFGRYATLAAITDATVGPLGKNGLAVIQESELCEDGVTIYTWMVHESGAVMEFTPMTLPLEKRTPQGVGSAITYGRRYQLAAICGLAPDDDDGTEAEKNAPKRPSMSQTTRPPVQPPTRPAAPKQDAPPAPFTLTDVDPLSFDDAPTPTDEFLAIPSQQPGMVNGHPAGNGKAHTNGKQAQADKPVIPAFITFAEGVVEWARNTHRSGDEPCSPAQYGFLAGVINKITGEAESHHGILSHLTGRPTTGENRIDKKLANDLLDLLPETKTVKNEDGTKTTTKNEKHKPTYVSVIKWIHTLEAVAA